MSISGSLSNALSGMTAAAHAAEIISSNVANASTDGYGRRVQETSSRVIGSTGSGVKIDGVKRDIDLRILSDRRLSDAETAGAQTRAAFFTTAEALIGLPGDGSSLTDAYSALQTALIDAASRPDSEIRLQAISMAADTLATKFQSISDGVQAERMAADAEIARQVGVLNDNLAKVADLNSQIMRQEDGSSGVAALMDQRQVLVDEIAGIVPLRQIDRDGGQIALMTTNGATLLDGRPAEVSFAASGLIVPEMSLASGALSGLEINGVSLATSGAYSPIAGGSLAALFEVRDADAPALQAELDAVARDVVERFQATGVDPTMAAGDPGLFTDAGLAFAAADEVGLSSRLSVNALVLPAQGGAVTLLRDGLGATVAGPVGDASQLNRWLDALANTGTTASGSYAGQAHEGGELAARLLSHTSALLQSAGADEAYAAAKNTALRTTELERGVDTDQELQALLVVENAYAANARVIQTADDMLRTLLEL